ncbi:hypothetical protein WOC76_22005 [Methylocystis sp. IM3]|uniref:hypothetical protein n=1 Tax=unclassified Methylocystis TaxID=2625913 RepID=UPI000F9422A2|nr:MAG: hypothetical protein EKK29_11905 [Hyphomicrobiales bacterium]
MNIRLLTLAFGFAAAMTLGSAISMSQARAESATKPENIKAETAKSEMSETHKEHGKHEKAHHEKKEGLEAGESKEVK